MAAGCAEKDRDLWQGRASKVEVGFVKNCAYPRLHPLIASIRNVSRAAILLALVMGCGFQAFAEAKRKLNLTTVGEHDDYLHDLLEHNLIYRDGGYVWPRGIRTALVYWNVTPESHL